MEIECVVIYHIFNNSGLFSEPESLCRRPVPESGDSSRSSLKLNSEEN